MDKRPTLLFDGDCGMCDKSMERLQSTMQPPVDFQTYQSADLDALGVPEQAVMDGPVLVLPGGTYLVGPAAMAEVMTLAGGRYATLGRMMSAPGPRQFLAWIGPKMYHQRYRMPGADDSCRVPAA